MGETSQHDAAVTGPDWRRRAEASLAAAGHRSGGARGAVIELLSHHSCALSAHEIADGLRRDGTKVGLASVYRALDLLEAHGLLQRIDLPEGGSRFEPAVPGGEHHHHAVCDLCGELTPFEDARLEAVIDEVSARMPHRITTHDVVLRGVCRRCAGGEAR